MLKFILPLISLLFISCTHTGVVEYKKMNPATLSASSIIMEGDSVAIRLTAAHVEKFKELFNFDGEIAIVVNAYELKSSIDFTPDSINKGRLVYYSGGIRQGETLNFINMPIYGPKEYNGYPFVIDMYVIELDADQEQTKSLLSTLSSYGKVAYPTASPVLEVLNNLGNSLINTNINDDVMRFTMMFDPAKKNVKEGTLSYPVLAEGNYIYVNKEENDDVINWNDIGISQEKWRVININDNTSYNKHTYLSLQIIKNLSSLSIDLGENTFGKFLDVLKDEDKKNGQLILADLNASVETRNQIFSFHEAKELMKNLEDKNSNKIKYKKSFYDLKIILKDSKLNNAQKKYIYNKLIPLYNTDANVSCQNGLNENNISKISYECLLIGE